MYRILVTWRYFGIGDKKENIERLFSTHNCIGEIIPLEEAIPRLGEFDGIIVGTDILNSEIFDKAPRLRAIMKYGVGTDNIDKKAAKEKNIKIFNLPGINCEAVAELVLGYIFALGRKILISDRMLKSGKWIPSLGSSIKGKTLGILGTGAVGLTVTEMVSGLKMKVIGYDIYQNEQFTNLGGQYVDRDEIFCQADYLSIHIPLNEKTYHSIGEKEFKLMKKSAYLMNTSRGAIVDEKKLYQAVKTNEIAGAAVDVYETEPVSQSILLELDNMITTPHIAAFSYDTFRRMDRESVTKLSKALHQ